MAITDSRSPLFTVGEHPILYTHSVAKRRLQVRAPYFNITDAVPCLGWRSTRGRDLSDSLDQDPQRPRPPFAYKAGRDGGVPAARATPHLSHPLLLLSLTSPHPSLILLAMAYYASHETGPYNPLQQTQYLYATQHPHSQSEHSDFVGVCHAPDEVIPEPLPSSDSPRSLGSLSAHSSPSSDGFTIRTFDDFTQTVPPYYFLNDVPYGTWYGNNDSQDM